MYPFCGYLPNLGYSSKSLEESFITAFIYLHECSFACSRPEYKNHTGILRQKLASHPLAYYHASFKPFTIIDGTMGRRPIWQYAPYHITHMEILSINHLIDHSPILTLVSMRSGPYQWQIFKKNLRCFGWNSIKGIQSFLFISAQFAYQSALEPLKSFTKGARILDPFCILLSWLVDYGPLY